jgi:histidinol dehydrogenase
MRIERIEWDGERPTELARRLRRTVAPEDVSEPVAEIIAAVAERGDDAVRELEIRFGAGASGALRVDPGEVRRAAEAASPELRDALDLAAGNIVRVAEAELGSTPASVEFDHHRVSVLERPVGAVGVYAPGGRASYPSSVLMCALPARVAGVRRIAVASPPRPDGELDPAVLAACCVAGVDEVYAIGGAQAIAALALGTESVAAVDVIAGPGNPYVTEAKRQLFGRVGIEALAGPSELAVLADASVEPRWIALDLLAQAEHGPDGALFAISADAGVLEAVERLIRDLAAQRPTVSDATLSSIRAPELQSALALCDAIAPEHLELALADAGPDLARARTAGCVFIGPLAATAFGDYAAGSNHVLPTNGAARFSGPLGPGAFMRRTSVVSVDREAAATMAPVVDTLARAEGLPVHGESALARAGENEQLPPATKQWAEG